MTNNPPIFPALWFTSGTPINLGMRECPMERYLAYHAGTHGTGWKRKAQAVPLATGSGVHTGVELIGGWILDWQKAHPRERLVSVPDEVIAWAATEAADGYARTAIEKGLQLTSGDVQTDEFRRTLVLEQRTLIEAQVWIYALARLPVMLADHRLLEAEHEEGPVLDCSCGLGDWVGAWTDHHRRGCAGIVMQGRSDAIWERVDDGTLVYEELKTKATANYGWDQQWETSGQLLLNMEAASRRLGRDVGQAYVPVLYKGKRDRNDRSDKSQPKIQQSFLCYGWFDPGNGMTRMPEWAARYKWFDDYTGKGHTLPRTFIRVPVWNEEFPLTGDVPTGVTFRDGASRVEKWVRGWVLPVQYAEVLKTLGPFPKPTGRVPDAIESLIVNERRWRDDVAELRQYKVYQPGDVGEELLTVGQIIPRSWACTKFDGTPCTFKRICLKEEGWQRMEAIEEYEIRTPHHQLEKDAVKQISGVVFPETEEEEE